MNKLEKGKIICPECNGVGHIKIKKKYFVKRLCPLCLGMKKVDWLDSLTFSIENIGEIMVLCKNASVRDFSVDYKDLCHQWLIKELGSENILRVERVG